MNQHFRDRSHSLVHLALRPLLSQSFKESIVLFSILLTRRGIPGTQPREDRCLLEAAQDLGVQPHLLGFGLSPGLADRVRQPAWAGGADQKKGTILIGMLSQSWPLVAWYR